MSAGAIAIVVVIILALGIPVSLGIVGDEKAKSREWRPDGAGAWWHRPIRPLMLAQSLTVDGRSSAIIVETRDPRIVHTTRRLSAPTNGVGTALKRAQVERVRRVAKRPRVARQGAAS